MEHREQPGPSPPQTPLGLDYFAPPTSARRLSKGVEAGVAIALLGWIPFVCGMINLRVASYSYSPAVSGSHLGGAVLFLTAGVIVSCVGLVRLASLKHAGGVFFAITVVASQVGMAGCSGVAYFGGW